MHRNSTTETENDCSWKLNTLQSVFLVKADSKTQANMHKSSPVPEPIYINSFLLQWKLFRHQFKLLCKRLSAIICIFSMYSMKSLQAETSCCALTMKRGQLLLKPQPKFLSRESNVPWRLLIMTLKGSFMIKCQQSAHCSACFWTVDSTGGIWTLRCASKYFHLCLTHCLIDFLPQMKALYPYSKFPILLLLYRKMSLKALLTVPTFLCTSIFALILNHKAKVKGLEDAISFKIQEWTPENFYNSWQF